MCQETEQKDFFEVYAVGFVSASVCTNLSVEKATERLNKERPTGISSQWELAEEKTFAGGQPMPFQCPDRTDCKHYLFHC